MSKIIPPFDASSGHYVDPPRPTRAATARPTVRAPDPSHDLMTIAMVAADIKSSTRHVRRLIDRGELPVHRIGSLLRVSRDDYARYLSSTRCS